jgi:hypothetical protein
MASENVVEKVVRRVFTGALDVVVHMERDEARRQVTEIAAIVPRLGDDHTSEPIFVRPSLGQPLEWTGALPSGLEARIDKALPMGVCLRTLLERGQRIPA